MFTGHYSVFFWTLCAVALSALLMPGVSFAARDHESAKTDRRALAEKNMNRLFGTVQDPLAETDPDATAVRLEAGSFIVLFPQDAHCPGRCVEESTTVKKIIGKVRI